jgi:hypothetical protein
MDSVNFKSVNKLQGSSINHYYFFNFLISMRGARSYYSPLGAKNLATLMNIQRICVQYGTKMLVLFCFY